MLDISRGLPDNTLMLPGPDAVTVPTGSPPPDAVVPTIAPVPPAPAEAVVAGPPTGADILRWCAAIAPKVWFPAVQAKESGIPRADFDNPLWVLRQTGLLRVSDWVKGLGQGFTLTPEGEAAVANPGKPLPTVAPLAVPPPDVEAPEAPVAPRSRRLVGMSPLERGELARTAILAPRPTVVSTALIFANVAWFLVGAVVAWRMGASYSQYLKDGDPVTLLRIGAVSGGTLLSGEWWRLITSTFGHFGLVHLFANMFALAVLGPIAENFWGRWRFAALYGVGGLAGSCLAMAVRPESVLAGASGSIWAVQTCVATWLVLYRKHLPEQLVRGSLRTLAVVMIVNGVISFAPGISWEGHLGGAIIGVLGGILLDFARPANGTRGKAALVGFGLLTAAGPIGLAVAMDTTDAWKRVETLEGLRALVKLRTEARDTFRDLEKVDPAAVHKVQERATHTLINLEPTAHANRIVATREAVASLAAEAAAARERLGSSDGPASRGRLYLDEVEKLLRLLDGRLADAKLPTEAEWKAIGEQRKVMLTAWNGILTANQVIYPGKTGASPRE